MGPQERKCCTGGVAQSHWT